MLETLGIAATPRLHVWNKMDLLDDATRRRLGSDGGGVTVSALTGEGLETLLRRIDQALTEDPVVEADFDLPVGDGARLAMLYRSGNVLSVRADADRVHVRARVPESLRERLQPRPPRSPTDR